MLATRTTRTLLPLAARFISSSSCLCVKKTRLVWDERFAVFPDDVAPDKKGGSEEMMKALPEEIRAPTGVHHRVTNEYIHVPEMVPEFVVPDLTGFELKPYVSYRAKEIHQATLSPRDIFDFVYAGDIENDLREGRLEVIDGHVVSKDGRVVKMDQPATSDS